jgi:PPOX class probable F420-dependent enzyme
MREIRGSSRAGRGRGAGLPLARVALGVAPLALAAASFVALDRAAVRRRETDETPDGPAGRHPFAPLRGQRYVRLATFRKSGEEVSTPVWFALYGGRLYVTTPPDSGKMKRIRNDPRVTLAPSDFRGKPKGGVVVEGLGRSVADEPTPGPEGALRRKYWFGLAMFHLFGRGEYGEVTLEVRPA